MASRSWLIFAALLVCAVAEFQTANFLKCDEDSQTACVVREVRIDPCNNKRCIFKKRHNASISFDFVPNFQSSKLTTTLFWANGASDVAFDQMTNVNACDLTTCPTQPGQSQSLDYTLYIGQKLPQGSYTFKWKLWNPDDESQMCCFRTTVKIRK